MTPGIARQLAARCIPQQRSDPLNLTKRHLVEVNPRSPRFEAGIVTDIGWLGIGYSCTGGR